MDVGLWADRGDTPGRTNSVSWVTKSIAGEGVEAPVSAACATKLLGAAEPAFKLQPGQMVTVAVAMKSSFDVKDPPAAVRVGYDPGLILKELREMIEAIGGANGFTLNNKHGVENCCTVPNTINEMLCMGHEHVLRLFPVWPKEKDARFMGIRTWDAFLFSSELKGGVVQYVKIHSEKGRDGTLQNHWPGKTACVMRNGRPAESVTGSRLMLKSCAGETIEVEP